MPHALTLTLLLLPSLLFTCHVTARNPLILPSVGLADPHVRVINNSLFMFATHDDSANSSDFLMRNWWVWTSDNMVTPPPPTPSPCSMSVTRCACRV